MRPEKIRSGEDILLQRAVSQPAAVTVPSEIERQHDESLPAGFAAEAVVPLSSAAGSMAHHETG